jgi:glutaredoxin-dependent peroxiredoxin
VSIAAISRDSPYSHSEYSKRLWLDFPLLSDWNAEAVRAFGVSQELDGLADSPVRSAFVVDADGVIRFAKRYGDSQVPDADELLAACRDVTKPA